jgi:Ran GTPase-activating protein (RanGAP) involved in mRNA processing and transport
MESNKIKAKNGKFTNLHPDCFTNILNMITNRENSSVILELNKSFLKSITSMLRKDNSLSQCMKDLKSIIKSIEEFKYVSNNHCINLEENLKKIKDNYSPFTFNRGVYLISSYIFKDVQSLDIQKNNMGMDGIILIIPLIKKSNILVHLNLSYNNICDEGCKFLSLALKKSNTVQIVNVECNGITDLGLISMSDVICNHKSLKTLKFALNSITFEGVKYLASMLEKSTNQMNVIDFKYNNLVIKDEYLVDNLRKQKISF